MHLISYISDRTGAAETVDRDLADIVAVAKPRNRTLGITGLLFFEP